MKKRIAIGAAVALIASLAFATIASATDQFDNGEYTVDLPDDLGTVEFVVTDGEIGDLVLPEGFRLVTDDDDDSDDAEEIEITNDLVVVEIEADDDAVDGVSVEVESVDDDSRSEDDDSVSGDDTLSEDDDSVSGDDADSEEEVETTTPATQGTDDDSVSGDDADSDDDSEDDGSN